MIAKTPLSDRACQGLVVFFSLWTLCSHIAVAAGAGLQQLVGLAGIALTLAALVWWRSHRGGAAAAVAESAASETPTLA